MSDSGACQRPQLILPHGRLLAFTTVPTAIRPMYVPNSKMAGRWLELGEHLCNEAPDTDGTLETAEYLLDLACNGLVAEAPPLWFSIALR